jgi:hypothetical protein
MTARISQMPRDYREGFASKFEIFNFKNIAPPAWATEGTGNFLDWKQAEFFNDSDSGAQLRDHFFYLIFVFLATCAAHRAVMAANDRFRLMERFAGAADNRLPKELKFPNVEIGEFMALSMGMLDLGTRVLTDPKASVGWKVLALAEVSCSCLLIFWLYTKAKGFHERNEWRENKNMVSFSGLGSIDANGDGLLSLDELRDQAYRVFNGDIFLDPSEFTREELDDEKNRIVVTPEDAETVFKKMVREKRVEFDEAGCMSVKMDEFVHELYLFEMAPLGAIGSLVLPEALFLAKLKEVPFARTSLFEGLYTMLPFVGNVGVKVGEYYPRIVKDEGTADAPVPAAESHADTDWLVS